MWATVTVKTRCGSQAVIVESCGPIRCFWVLRAGAAAHQLYGQQKRSQKDKRSISDFQTLPYTNRTATVSVSSTWLRKIRISTQLPVPGRLKLLRRLPTCLSSGARRLSGYSLSSLLSTLLSSASLLSLSFSLLSLLSSLLPTLF